MLSTEVRALQPSDIPGAEEPFDKGQKGSSAMPHKRNPITAERVVIADSTIALDCRLGKLEWILDGLVRYPEKMKANLEEARGRIRGRIYSSRVLLYLVDTGIAREDTYAIGQTLR